MNVPLGAWEPWTASWQQFSERNPKGEARSPEWLDYRTSPYWTPPDYPYRPGEPGTGLLEAGRASRWLDAARPKVTALLAGQGHKPDAALAWATDAFLWGLFDYAAHRNKMDRRDPIHRASPFFDLFDPMEAEGQTYPHAALDHLEVAYRAAIARGATACAPGHTSWHPIMDGLDRILDTFEVTPTVDAVCEAVCLLVAAYGLAPQMREGSSGERLGIRMWRQRNADVTPQEAKPG